MPNYIELSAHIDLDVSSLLGLRKPPQAAPPTEDEPTKEDEEKDA